jgi:signal transduction histidine kinase/ActR/RegA family two-component response regulator
MTPDITPGSSAPRCQVVGLGASAGGLESLERFFHAVSAAPGMAFVVVQHTSPDFRSVTDELIRRFTSLTVKSAEDGVPVEPDTVYVLPPAKQMILADGRLSLADKDPNQPPLPIDHFFRSIAHECGTRGAAVILSGRGRDGSRGAREVHQAGGVVLAETDDTARFDGMPGSARRAGVVDRVLRPEEMPAALLRWARATGEVESARHDLSRLSERRLQAEHAAARLAADATTFEEAAPRLAETLRETLGVDFVEFYMPGAEGRLAPASGGTIAADELDPAWPERARRLGRMVWFSEVPGEGGEEAPGGAGRLGVRSGLAFPVVRADECLAVIAACSRDPLPPAPELLATVAAIGQTVGQLIRRGRAESELRGDVMRRDRFLAMLSHELRNPLAAARAAVIALQRNHLDRQGRHAAYDVIGRQVQHMSHLLDDLLDVARVTQDRLKLQRERFDLSLAITGAQEMVAPLAAEREVRLEVDAFAEPAMVLADRVRITQMIGNLLANSVKYSPPRALVRLTAQREEGQVVIRVIDRGAGMSREVLEHAFDLFYQADETLDRRQSGMGVGLTLARTIAALHGGALSASSPGPGQGSTFEVRLPVAPAPTEQAPPEVRPEGRSYRIVLVEDHEDNREMIRLLLGCEGHRVDVAADGADGLSLIERLKPDVALVDIGLPGIDGFTVAQRVRENPALAVVGLIALSGYAQASDVEHARESGFDAHVAKPTAPDHLLDVVASVVREKASN